MKTTRIGVARSRPRATGAAQIGRRRTSASSLIWGRRAAAVTRRTPVPSQPSVTKPRTTTASAERRVTATPPMAAIDAPSRTQPAPMSMRSRSGSARTTTPVMIRAAAIGSHRSRASMSVPAGRRATAAAKSATDSNSRFKPNAFPMRSAWPARPIAAARARIRIAIERVIRPPSWSVGRRPGCGWCCAAQPEPTAPSRRPARAPPRESAGRWRTAQCAAPPSAVDRLG